MDETLNRLAYNSAIWDLHIHTCSSPKSSGEFQEMDVEEYVDYLVSTFKKTQLIKNDFFY